MNPSQNARSKTCKTSDCDELMLRRYYLRYHRFVLLSPLFLLVLFIVAFELQYGSGNTASLLLGIVFLVILIKELILCILSQRIYRHVLLPIEKLKQGVYAVSQGKFGVSVPPAPVQEIDELIQAFNTMSAKLKESQAAEKRYESNRKELISNISHDLKTPITAINGFADALSDGIARDLDKQSNYVRIIQQNARYMNRLIDDLVLYSKLDVQQLEFQFQPFDFRQYIEELFLELQLEMEEVGISMVLRGLPASSVPVQIDPRHLTRAIRNLVNNARVHGGHPQLALQFQVETGISQVSLTISDNGPGFPEESLPHLFERFYKGDKSRHVHSGGSGLGLAITREILIAHGGSAEARNGYPNGAQLTLTLPIIQEE